MSLVFISLCLFSPIFSRLCSLFYLLFLALPRLCGCVLAFSSCGERGFLSSCSAHLSHWRGLCCCKGFPCGSDGKASACNVEDLGSIPGVGNIPWRRKWQPTPVFMPEKSHRQRSMVGYSPRSCKESDTTEQLHSLLLQSTCSGLHGLQDLQHRGSVAVAPGLWNTGSVILLLGFSCSLARGIFPPGIKPVCPALTGGFCH